MSDNKLIAIVIIGCLTLSAVGIISVSLTEKTEHEKRMEKIQELDAMREVIRKTESEFEMIRIKREMDSMHEIIQNS